MLVVRETLLDVSVTEGTVLTIMDSNPWERVLLLHNRDAVLSLTLQIQKSVDGGATWVDYGSAFTLGIDGSGTEVAVKTILGSGVFRLRGSGGSNNSELEISLVEFEVTSTTQFPWVK